MSGETSSPLAKVDEHIFDPSLLFLSDVDVESSIGKIRFRNDLIILNRPLQVEESFLTIWKGTKYKICADGGSNRLWDACDELERLVPTAIVGDFDSIRPEVKDSYSKLGAHVFEDGDQYSTDFGKSMKVLKELITESEIPKEDDIRNVLIISDLSGRVDQGIGILHEMLRETVKSQSERLRLWLINSENVSWILPSGKNVLRNLKAKWTEKGSLNGKALFTPNVGILPIYGPAKISTTGLEWDIKDWDTQMGGMVSTSNHVVEDEVIVESSNMVLFTIERFSTS